MLKMRRLKNPDTCRQIMEKTSWKGAWKGISFGLASGVITTLGMMVGIDATTNSRLAVLASILAIAIADSFSDSVGIHISEESEGKKSKRGLDCHNLHACVQVHICHELYCTCTAA